MLHLFVFYIIPCYTLHYGVRAAVMQASEMIAHDITLHLMNYEHIILHYTSWIHHITLHLMNSGYTILQYIPWIIDTACVLQCFVSTRHLLVIRLSQFQSKKTVKMIICKRPTEQVRRNCPPPPRDYFRTAFGNCVLNICSSVSLLNFIAQMRLEITKQTPNSPGRRSCRTHRRQSNFAPTTLLARVGFYIFR